MDDTSHEITEILNQITLLNDQYAFLQSRYTNVYQQYLWLLDNSGSSPITNAAIQGWQVSYSSSTYDSAEASNGEWLSLKNCQKECSSSSDCVGATYSSNTGACTLYTSTTRSVNIIQNGNFAQPDISSNDYEYIISSTTVPGWNFNNAILVNSSSAWGYYTPYPYGSQCVSIQNGVSLSQTVNLPAGSFTLSLYACGRPGGSNLVNVVLTNSANTSNTIYTIDVSNNVWTPCSVVSSVSVAGKYTLTFQGTAANGSLALQNIQLLIEETSTVNEYDHNIFETSLYIYTITKDVKLIFEILNSINKQIQNKIFEIKQQVDILIPKNDTEREIKNRVIEQLDFKYQMYTRDTEQIKALTDANAKLTRDLTETSISVTQSNTEYMFWFIIAVIVFIVAIKVVYLFK